MALIGNEEKRQYLSIKQKQIKSLQIRDQRLLNSIPSYFVPKSVKQTVVNCRKNVMVRLAHIELNANKNWKWN